MHISSLRQMLCIFIVYRLNIGLALPNSSHGTNFTHWSEDDWLETQFSINTKFIFNGQHYEHVILRSRMNEWSLELSYGNKSHRNEVWAELHLFFDHYNHSTSLNNSIFDHVRHQCHPPIVSLLTNNSDILIPELAEMDERIGKYFITDGFFRTINYLRCTIDERRRNPSIRIQIDIYLVTNRNFQSLLYIEMSNGTRSLFLEHQARFYLHNYEKNFKYNFNASNINYPLNSDTALVYMIKLYNQIKPLSSNSIIISCNVMMIMILFNFFFLSTLF